MKRFYALFLIMGVLLLSACSSQSPSLPQNSDELIESFATNVLTIKPAEPINEELPKLSLEQTNALKSAQSYLKHMDFSRSGLIDQLLYEKYSEEVATWAVDQLDADWMAEAVESAVSYIRYSGFSYSGLINQLDYEGFSSEEATYGADNCGADWNNEALECAESYLRYSSFSKAQLENQLDYEGFTAEQIAYAIAGVGY